MKAVFNCRRGLAIDSLVVRSISDKSLIGTIPHGYYQDITLGADFYTGHLVLETPGRPKITDLAPVDAEVYGDEQEDSVMLHGSVATPLGRVQKTIRVSREGRVRIQFYLEWEQLPIGSLRLGHITLNPEAFDPEDLFFETHNGGFTAERFAVGKKAIEHGRSVSFLVSSTSALGMTAGEMRIGDRKRSVKVRTPLAQACVVAQITYKPLPGSFFYRASFSVAELDETCREGTRTAFPRTFEFDIGPAADAASG
jgi:hypothetical protein